MVGMIHVASVALTLEVLTLGGERGRGVVSARAAQTARIRRLSRPRHPKVTPVVSVARLLYQRAINRQSWTANRTHTQRQPCLHAFVRNYCVGSAHACACGSPCRRT